MAISEVATSYEDYTEGKRYELTADERIEGNYYFL